MYIAKRNYEYWKKNYEHWIVFYKEKKSLNVSHAILPYAFEFHSIGKGNNLIKKILNGLLNRL